MDSVRKDFVEAYTQKWDCEEKYTEELMQHVENAHVQHLVSAVEKILSANSNITAADLLAFLKTQGA